MKSKNITTIILEGTDGVGKDSIAYELWQDHTLQYRIYVRGELSDYVYAKKYNRNFSSTQRGLPFVYVLLTVNENVLKSRIIQRGNDGYNTTSDIDKISDQELFLSTAKEMSNDYHVLVFDTTNYSIKECAKEIIRLVDEYCKTISVDSEINEYNNMYKKGCDKLNLNFYVKNNQPYINDRLIMADAQLHNGMYESFSNKDMPHNFIFSLGYSGKIYKNIEKQFDFCYIISSKIQVRQEINEYFESFKNNQLTCLTRECYKNKVFGDEYIQLISKAKATVYCCRDLAYLKMITVRPYEAVLSQQIIFVDQQSDPENEILRQIHGKSKFTELLYVTPENICERYKQLNKKDVLKILKNQVRWYRLLYKKIREQFK